MLITKIIKNVLKNALKKIGNKNEIKINKFFHNKWILL